MRFRSVLSSVGSPASSAPCASTVAVTPRQTGHLMGGQRDITSGLREQYTTYDMSIADEW